MKKAALYWCGLAAIVGTLVGGTATSLTAQAQSSARVAQGG